MKLHSHYCQDPHCPSRWDDAVRANMPREERRPKLGDRVRPFYVGSREPIPSIHSVEALRVRTFAYVAADGLLSWLRYEERGVTWDFASEEPAKEPPHIFARRFCWCSLAAGALQRVDELRKAGAGLCPMITFDAGIAGQRGELLGSGQSLGKADAGRIVCVRACERRETAAETSRVVVHYVGEHVLPKWLLGCYDVVCTAPDSPANAGKHYGG